MKRIYDIEKKVYEILGVKQFKKFVLLIFDIIVKIKALSKPKEDREAFLKNKAPTNYTIGSIKSLDSIKDFKKEIFFNGCVHVCSAILFINFLNEDIISEAPSILAIAYHATFLGLNAYCIMLQRYNYIRIKRVVEKAKPKYEAEKEKVREDLRKSDTYLLDKEFQKHAYKMIIKGKEKKFDLEKSMAKANLEQLRLYRKLLISLDLLKEDYNYYGILTRDKQVDLKVKLDHKKTLKLEVYNNIKK